MPSLGLTLAERDKFVCLVCGLTVTIVGKDTTTSTTIGNDNVLETDMEILPYFMKSFRVQLSEFGNENEQISFCEDCNNKLKFVQNLERRILELKGAVQCRLEEIKEKMEVCETAFQIERIYGWSEDAYKIRRHILGEVVIWQTSVALSDAGAISSPSPKRMVIPVQAQVRSSDRIRNQQKSKSDKQESLQEKVPLMKNVKLESDSDSEDIDDMDLDGEYSPDSMPVKTLNSDSASESESDYMEPNDEDQSSSKLVKSKRVEKNGELSEDDAEWRPKTVGKNVKPIEHMRKGHKGEKRNPPKKAMECPICGRPFGNNTQIKMHVITHYNKEEKLEAEAGGEVWFTKSDLKPENTDDEKKKKKKPRVAKGNESGKWKYHNITFKELADGNFTCLECSETASTRNRIMRHIIREHTDRFVCELCGMHKGCAAEVRQHILQVHKGRKRKPYTPRKITDDESENTGKKNARRRELITKLDESGKWKYRHITFEELTHGNFTCLECSETVTNRNRLMRHVNREHTDRYVCELCGLHKGCKAELRTHIRQVHKGEKRDPPRITTECPICGRPFGNKAQLALHIPTHYSEEDKREAEARGEKLKMKKTFQCGECGIILTSVSLFRHHQKNKHPKSQEDEDEARETCPHCGKLFSKVYIKLHLKRYHPDDSSNTKRYKCCYCPKTFITGGPLRYHKFTHTGARPYKCKVCDKSFNRHLELKRHCTRSHPG